jgi:hypothetical protein
VVSQILQGLTPHYCEECLAKLGLTYGDHLQKRLDELRLEEEAPIVERKIVVYGHGDKRPGLDFPTGSGMEHWIKEDIFTKHRGRYHYTIGKEADVVILSRDGLVFGHFEIEGKEKPDQKDFQDHPDLKFVYIVRSSGLYGKAVRLSNLGIKDIRFGKSITEAQFDEIKKAAGEVQEYRP